MADGEDTTESLSHSAGVHRETVNGHSAMERPPSSDCPPSRPRSSSVVG